MKRRLLNYSTVIKTGYAEWFIEFVYIVYKKKYNLVEIPYIQNMDEDLRISKSYPNFFTFIYLGCTYFFRIILTIIRN